MSGGVRLPDEAIERPADPQYGDMQGAELAAARTDPHLSACDEPVFDHCPLCVRARDRIRRIVRAAAPLLVEAGRREALDGAEVVYGGDNGPAGIIPIRARAEDVAAIKSPAIRALLRWAYRTEWRAVQEGGGS